jgi:pimeloyl-ACP methyl ester carboxylesterase
VDPGTIDRERSARSLEANGFRLNYVVTGDGPPAVLVHGEASSLLDWQWVVPGLSDLVRVHALDLPGHGDTTKPAAPYSAALLTDTLVAFLDALDLERVILVGHSLGGILATRAARLRPERVSGLCLVDSGGLGRAISPANILEALPGVGEMGLLVKRTEAGRWQHGYLRAARLHARWWRVHPSWLLEQRRLVGMTGFSEATLTVNRSTVDLWGQKESITEDLPHLDLPSLVLWGAEDSVVPFWHASRAAAALPDARTRLFQSCGHMPHVERPQAFVEELRAFLVERRLA